MQPTSEPRRTEEPAETATLTLEDMGPLGDTLANLDGEPLNVFGGIPGEEVVARIVRYRRRPYSISACAYCPTWSWPPAAWTLCRPVARTASTPTATAIPITCREVR